MNADDKVYIYTAVLAITAFGFAALFYLIGGWFGVGFVGFVGLWFANDARFTQRDKDGDVAYPALWRSDYSDKVYEQARQNYHDDLKRAGRSQDDVAAERAHLRRLKNTIFASIAVLGFGMVAIRLVS